MSHRTRILSIDRDEPDAIALDEAADVLRAGGLVAFATETVYGLGADATNPVAVARIYEAKGRPAVNPLIVHVASRVMAQDVVAEWPEAAETLARAFWPGPLTLVLPRAGAIPDLVTAGLETVGVRLPAPAVARGLIERLGRPIAAPSANRSAGPSPTLASHVLADLDGRIDLVLDSGQTTVGLESTVVDLTPREPRVLRPGPITAEQLEHALDGLRVRESVSAEASQRPGSPGQMAVHYAPRSRTIRVDSAAELKDVAWPRQSALLVIGPHDPPAVPVLIHHQFDLETPEKASRDLYVVLHQCDALGVDLIVIVPPPDRPEWRALRDRLWRASQPWRPIPIPHADAREMGPIRSDGGLPIEPEAT